MRLSVGYITSRHKPMIEWFVESLVPQLNQDDEVQVLVISDHVEIYGSHDPRLTLEHHEPKPCVWSGKHKITKDLWWSKPNSLNSFLCLAKYDFVVGIDDRCVLGPQWMQAVREAYAANRLVLGSYAKYHNMKVANGIIVDQGTFDGKDQRGYKDGVHLAPPQHFFGCCWCSPIDWCLQVNGFDERLNSVGMEDICFGHHLHSANYLLKADIRLFVTQDRTPSECEPVMRRTSKQRFNYDTNDKAWTYLKKFAKDKYADNGYSLRELRNSIQFGNPFPHHNNQPSHDWYDNMPIQDFDKL